eukprot:11186378-Lingulodinium_polyedra.AAC.1
MLRWRRVRVDGVAQVGERVVWHRYSRLLLHGVFATASAVIKFGFGRRRFGRSDPFEFERFRFPGGAER